MLLCQSFGIFERPQKCEDLDVKLVKRGTKKLYYGKNGNWSDGVGGGFDQSDFSNASGFALTRTTSNNNITFSTQNGASSSAFELIANWGNPPYSVSSSNNDGKYGNFEYAPPSGYYALCTKRLAEFG